MSRLLSPFTNYVIFFLVGLNDVCLCVYLNRMYKIFFCTEFSSILYYDLMKNNKNKMKSKKVIFRILEDLERIFGTD
jgi:hypothetical protein